VGSISSQAVHPPPQLQLHCAPLHPGASGTLMARHPSSLCRTVLISLWSMQACGGLCFCENHTGFLVIRLLGVTSPAYSEVKTSVACSWLLARVLARQTPLREFSEGWASFPRRARHDSRCGYRCPARCGMPLLGWSRALLPRVARVSVEEGLLFTSKVCCFSFVRKSWASPSEHNLRLSYLFCRQPWGR